jgi:hypothetical protein
LELDKRVIIYRVGESIAVKHCWTYKEAKSWVEQRKERGSKIEYQIFAPAQHEDL